ncbi:MAG: hypothetical protein US78_C0029G0006 [Parcubacteria group bacterium GW2011_GWD1_38_16]|nr:MAG: hypothetical protein US78_C0029G0006 [Parcubacteria group bacterium GW2011_GWD1_38_16]
MIICYRRAKEKSILKVGKVAMLLKNSHPNLPDRLMVGHLPLEQVILVRIQVRQIWIGMINLAG